jgi:hypothetical protein
VAGSRAIVHGGFGPCLTRAKGDRYFFLYHGACRTHVELELGSAEGSAAPLSGGLRPTHGTMDGEDCMLIILQARFSPESRVQSDRRVRPETSAIRDWQDGGSVCFIGSSMQSVSPVSRSSAVCASSNTCVSQCKPAVSRIQYTALLCSDCRQTNAKPPLHAHTGASRLRSFDTRGLPVLPHRLSPWAMHWSSPITLPQAMMRRVACAIRVGLRGKRVR